MRMLIVLTCLALLLMLAYYFFSPEKDLVTGAALRLRIKTEALLTVFDQEAVKSYEKVLRAKPDERLPVLRSEAERVWRALQDAYKKNAFLGYVNDLKTMTAGLLGTAREEINILGSGDGAKIGQSTPTSVRDFSRAVKTWLEMNEKRVHALSGVEGDDAETKAKDELAKLQGELRKASEELEKRVAAVPDTRKGFTPASYRGPGVVREEKAVASRAPIPGADSNNVAPAPEQILEAFRKRYLNRELRRTPYHFKDLKILKSSYGLMPGLYCISFSAEVYHNHDNKRWEKSPVVLNVIAKVGSDGIMSTYENFAKNPWDYPISGSCVKPIWGVHEYEWDKVCPYPCMGK
ncbi:MAG: hypothetical protein ACP5M0_15425 [Desulfomonilaceae bacterium]